MDTDAIPIRRERKLLCRSRKDLLVELLEICLRVRHHELEPVHERRSSLVWQDPFRPWNRSLSWRKMVQNVAE